MDAELKAKWIAALRSGEYKQGRDRLRCGNTFCCLGVFADVAGFKWRSDDNVIIPRTLSTASHYLPGTVLPIDFQRMITRKNDTGTTFAQIADIIERELVVTP